METNWQLDGYPWEKATWWGEDADPPGNAPCFHKKDRAGEISTRVGPGRWSWAGDGHGTASQCPLSLEQYPPWELPAAPCLSHSTGRETKEWRKTHPQSSSQLSRGAPGKSLGAKQRQPYTAGDNGDKAPGLRDPTSPSWLCALPALQGEPQPCPALTRDSSGTEWLPPPRPQCIGQQTETTWLCQHQNGTKPISTALSKQQWFPAWLGATPIIKMMVKYFIICSNYPQNINHWQALPGCLAQRERRHPGVSSVSPHTPKGCRM